VVALKMPEVELLMIMICSVFGLISSVQIFWV
jgi:hypothetical protein